MFKWKRITTNGLAPLDGKPVLRKRIDARGYKFAYMCRGTDELWRLYIRTAESSQLKAMDLSVHHERAAKARANKHLRRLVYSDYGFTAVDGGTHE